MAFHYYTGSDISEQRDPEFWRREPRWPIGTFDGPAKMAKQEIGNGRSRPKWQWRGIAKMAMEMAGAGQNRISGICKENPKNPDRIGHNKNPLKA